MSVKSFQQLKDNKHFNINLSPPDKSAQPRQEQELDQQFNLDQQQICEKEKQQNNALQLLIQNIKLKALIRRSVSNTRSRMFKKLNQTQFQLINDQSYPFQTSNIHNISKIKNLQQSIKRLKLQSYSLFNFVLRYIINFPIFQPSSSYKLIWDFFMIIMIFILIFVIPIRICFDIKFEDIFSGDLIQFAIVMTFLDILINMNTGYYDKGKLIINNRFLIIKKYVKQNIFNELLGSLSLIIYYIGEQGENNMNSILLLYYFKINHFSKVAKRLQEEFLLGPKIRNILKIISLLFKIFIIAHIYACIWIIMSKYEQNSGIKSWLESKELINSFWLQQYCQSFYFIIVTMCTVGYGDTTPQNSKEQLLCILTMLTTCGMFGYLINMIGIIIQDFQKAENEITKNMYVINSYMHNKQINKNLQQQIREYLQYFYNESSKRDMESETKIISQLPDNLRQTLQVESYKIILKDSLIFSQNFSKDVLLKTIPMIQECRYAPEEVILVGDTLDDGCIYFIDKGKVEIFIDISLDKYNQKIQSIYTLEHGQQFGAFSFFTDKPREFNVRSLEFTTLLKIKRKDFLDLLKQYPEDHESFCFIRDSMNLQYQYNLIGTRCISCKSSHHSLKFCPYIHNIFDNSKIIKKYNLSWDQQRQDHNRPLRNKDQSLKQNFEIISFAKIYIERNRQIIQDYYDKFLLIEDQSDNEEDEVEQQQQPQQQQNLTSQTQLESNFINQSSDQLRDLSYLNKKQNIKNQQQKKAEQKELDESKESSYSQILQSSINNLDNANSQNQQQNEQQTNQNQMQSANELKSSNSIDNDMQNYVKLLLMQQQMEKSSMENQSQKSSSQKMDCRKKKSQQTSFKQQSELNKQGSTIKSPDSVVSNALGSQTIQSRQKEKKTSLLKSYKSILSKITKSTDHETSQIQFNSNNSQSNSIKQLQEFLNYLQEQFSFNAVKQQAYVLNNIDLHFDSMMSFKNYMAWNNIEQVIQLFNSDKRYYKQNLDKNKQKYLSQFRKDNFNKYQSHLQLISVNKFKLPKEIQEKKQEELLNPSTQQNLIQSQNSNLIMNQSSLQQKNKSMMMLNSKYGLNQSKISDQKAQEYQPQDSSQQNILLGKKQTSINASINKIEFTDTNFGAIPNEETIADQIPKTKIGKFQKTDQHIFSFDNLNNKQ